MTNLCAAIATAFWLGILTSVSPCPLTTNIVAISYVGKKVTSTRQVFFSGLLYTLGRMTAYLALGMLLILSILSSPQLSFFLQKHMNKFLGPVLILAGMILLELIQINFLKFGVGERTQRWADNMGIWGAFLLGIIFALSFCPVSAALFFGSLIPIALTTQSGLVMPAVYGIATGLPVLIFALLLASGIDRVSQVYNKTAKFEIWIRRITGVIFIVVGIYYSLTYIFGFFA